MAISTRSMPKSSRMRPALKQAQAGLEQAQRDLDQAKLEPRYCAIVAEIDGVVTRRNVNPGNNVQAGQSLMAVRSLSEIWVDANFKETQLRDLRIGQRVDLEVDMYGGKQKFEGRISGFTMGTGSTLALLPPQNATGNFVKVVQRLPVRIELMDYDPESCRCSSACRSRRRSTSRASRPGRMPASFLQQLTSPASSRQPRGGRSHERRMTGRRFDACRADGPRASIPGSSPSPWSSPRSWRCSTPRSPTSPCATSPAACRRRSNDSEWVITSYLAANAIILPISGWLSARLGRRNYFLLSIAVFTLASALCGMATSLSMLILSRVLQGLAGGGLQPSSQGVLLDAFPPEKQGTAMTLFGVAALLAPVVGPTLGGYITDNYGWRWIFYLNLPVGLLALVMCHSRRARPRISKSRAAPNCATTAFKLRYARPGAARLTMICWEILLSKGRSGTGSATRSGACRRWLLCSSSVSAP